MLLWRLHVGLLSTQQWQGLRSRRWKGILENSHPWHPSSLQFPRKVKETQQGFACLVMTEAAWFHLLKWVLNSPDSSRRINLELWRNSLFTSEKGFFNSIRSFTRKWTQNAMCCGNHVLFVLSPPMLYTSPAILQSTSVCLTPTWVRAANAELQQQHMSVLQTGRFQHWQGITWIRDTEGKRRAPRLWRVRSQCWCVPPQPLQLSQCRTSQLRTTAPRQFSTHQQHRAASGTAGMASGPSRRTTGLAAHGCTWSRKAAFCSQLLVFLVLCIFPSC